MAGPLATIPDLEVRLGSTLAGADLARATANLTDVSTLVRTSAGSINWGLTAIAATTTPVAPAQFLVPEAVFVVVVQATLRAFRNPDGFAGENIGGAYAYTYGPGAQSGVYLTADEALIVRTAAGLEGPGARGFTGSIRTRSAYDGTPAQVIYVGDGIVGSEPIPLVQLA